MSDIPLMSTRWPHFFQHGNKKKKKKNTHTHTHTQIHTHTHTHAHIHTHTTAQKREVRLTLYALYKID